MFLLAMKLLNNNLNAEYFTKYAPKIHLPFPHRKKEISSLPLPPPPPCGRPRFGAIEINKMIECSVDN